MKTIFDIFKSDIRAIVKYFFVLVIVVALAVSAGAANVDENGNWTPENTNTDIPRLQYNDTYMAGASDRFLTSANYLCLQNLTVGYTFPKNLTQKAHIQKLRIYLVGDNIWVWSKRKGLDPRMVLAGAVNNSYYSAIRTLSAGVSVTF